MREARIVPQPAAAACIVPFYLHEANMDPETAPDYVRLYRRAFQEFGWALWNRRRIDEPGTDDALVVARVLRIEGNRDARKLAEDIERACRAAV
jgi:hypothetical protein